MVKENYIIKLLIDNPKALYQTMISESLEFKQFVKDNKNKSIEELAKTYNVDLLG